MFDILTRVPEDEAIPAVYEATLSLFQRERSQGRKQNNLPLTENELAAKLIAEIEEVEGKHPADLTVEETNRYIVEISRRLQQKLREENPIDEARARAVLEEMRAEYSGPHYGRR